MEIFEDKYHYGVAKGEITEKGAADPNKPIAPPPPPPPPQPQTIVIQQPVPSFGGGGGGGGGSYRPSSSDSGQSGATAVQPKKSIWESMSTTQKITFAVTGTIVALFLVNRYTNFKILSK